MRRACWLVASVTLACGAPARGPKVIAMPDAGAPPTAASIQRTKSEPPPAPKPVSVKVLAVDIQMSHACALTEQRKLRCWGENRLGQLGYGDTRPRLASEAADVLLPGPVESFSVDPTSTCAVVTGSVYCWGYVTAPVGGTTKIGDDEPIDPAARVPFARPVLEVAQGWGYACLRDNQGEVTCWGSNDRFQLGACPKAGCRKNPGMPDGMKPVKLGFKATALALGHDHSCALGENGGVRCWGFFEQGQLGYTEHLDPADVGDLPLQGRAVQLSADKHGTTALLADGMFTDWGDFSSISSRRPAPESFNVKQERSAPVLQMARGIAATCAVLQGGSVECWENLGEHARFIGYGRAWSPSSKAIDLPGPARQVSASKFKNRMCAVLMDGRLYCWGEASPEKVLGYDRTDDIGDDETPGEVGPVPFAP
jgi:alpha-tubulin suppressor-like RCC1 family protein